MVRASRGLSGELQYFPDYDVLIVGAGPAGAAAALNLAPHCRVLLIDRHLRPQQRIGESLVPAARRLFHDMGILDEFLAQQFAPNYGNRAWWGLPPERDTGASQVPYETDFLRDPDGPGWHLDRARFEQLLRRIAQQRGAVLAAPCKLESLRWDQGCWRVGLSHAPLPQRAAGQAAAGAHSVRVRLVLDASGRSAVVARRLGAQRHHDDALVCGWLYGHVNAESATSAGFSSIEAVPEGWWYCAPLPDQRRVLAFHTDADLSAASWAKNPGQLLQRAQQLPGIGPLLRQIDFQVGAQHGYTAAHSARLSPCAGPAWLALGDAALCFDPLSSQGLFKALYSAWLGARSALATLTGKTQALDDYRAAMARIAQSYEQQLRYWYGSETRWQQEPFWQRRQAAAASKYSSQHA